MDKSIIKINDILEELKDENNRLNNELLFANKCLNVLNKFKSYLYSNYINKCKCDQSFDNNSNQLKDFENEFNSIINEKQIKNNNNIEINNNFTNNSKQIDSKNNIK